MEQLKINLFNAYYKARKNKRNTYNQLRFEINYEQELFQLYQEIKYKTYSIEKSITFIIEKPVKREIFAASFKDRVIHHLIFNYINPILEKQFIEDSYSCRKGKGTLYGIKRAENFMKQCSENFTQDCYVLKLDIQGYFMGIDKHLLKNKLAAMLSEQEFNKLIATSTNNKPKEDISYKTLWWLIDLIIFNDATKDCIIKGKLSDWKNLPISKSLFHSQPNCGLPIGNLTSQLFSNVYFHCFDQWIKTNGQINYYGRYVDDFFIIHQNKEYLISLLADIKDYLLSHDKLIIHPKKIYLQQYNKGFLFLGAYIKPYRTYIGNKTKMKFKALVLEYANYFEKKKVPIATISKFRDSVNSYLGIMKHHKTFNLKLKTLVKKQPNLIYNYGYFTSNLNIYKIKNNEL